jgi:outer membrane protein assembly factor BamB
MKLAPRRALACLPLLAVFLMVSCQAPAAPAAAPPKAVVSYALDPANPVFNLERENLKVAWRQEFGQTATGQLAHIYAGGNYLVAEGSNDQVLVYNAADFGTYKGAAVLEGPLQFAPAVSGPKLYLATHNRIFTLDAATDTLGKGIHTGLALSVTPLIRQDSLILASSGGYVGSLSPAAGNLDWSVCIDAPILDQPVVAGDTVYAAGQLGPAIALKLDKKGEELWRFKPKDPAKLNSGIAVYGKTCYVGDSLGTLYGLSADLGAEKWTKPLNSPVVGVPQVIGDKVLVFTNLPNVTCLSGDAGPQVLWTLPGAQRLLCSSKMLAYFLMADNSIAAVGLQDGKVAWQDAMPPDTLVAGSSTRPEFFIANPAGSIVAIAELE